VDLVDESGRSKPSGPSGAVPRFRISLFRLVVVYPKRRLRPRYSVLPGKLVYADGCV
jgi:hypothetical protein